ncbi:CocE/NonD family hydrolase [Gracilimonas amylolytica]|uniref:CocE/NonD family hydrolase n=1 Tax=Gracilimonas amylolytica TaxID=1749045 RepID=UPI0018E4AA48|nr:CocE/NonD family hydrolase [Gracilimonas amylolytica]
MRIFKEDLKEVGLVLIFVLGAIPLFAQQTGLKSTDYEKSQYYIEMRDGVKLHTIVYAPNDASRDYPILMTRTPYSCAPYAEDAIPDNIIRNPDLQAEGFIIVCQDVRGRWMSDVGRAIHDDDSKQNR